MQGLNHWLAAAEAGLVGDLTSRLHGRAGSIYRVLGEETAASVARRVVAALCRDLQGSEQAGLRELLQALMQELQPKGLGYADLRLLTVAVRQLVLAALAAAPEVPADARERVAEWMFQLAVQGSMRYVARREQQFQEQAAALEVRQLEGQLAELKAAFEEKTRLLDVIRQASTPIAPVYDGIIVVPLVGMFDAFRAQVLTEKLLEGIVQSRAYVVLLDVTGVPVFDAEAAQHIVRTALAVRLLGTELILVGLSPDIARTIVELDIDLAGLTTLGTLQAGLARAFALRKLKVVPIVAPQKRA
jgi:anti-anti-sigma regulatory factor